MTGFMASGKTTLGKRLARALSLQFFDLDHCIEKSQQLFISTIFTQFGEEQFRIWEEEELRKFSTKNNFVLASGGGTPTFFNNMEFMKQNGIVVYIKMTAEQLESRLRKAKNPRPLMQGLSKEERLTKIKSLLAERSPVYQQAHLTIDGLNPNLQELITSIQAQSR